MPRRDLQLNDPKVGGTYGERLWAIKLSSAKEWSDAAVASREQYAEHFNFSREDYQKRLSLAFQDGWAVLADRLWEFIDDRRARGFADKDIVTALIDAFTPEVEVANQLGAHDDEMHPGTPPK